MIIMKKQFLKLGLLALSITLAFTACKKDKGESNEEEVITTLQLTFTPQAGGAPLVFKYDDPDGPGGNAPTTDLIALTASTAYDVSLQLFNKTANPVEEITEEVEEESDAHRFYFAPTAQSNITVTQPDKDANGVDLGLNSVWTTGIAGDGSIKVTLRHYPNDPPGKAASDAVDSPKSGTDVEVTFSTRVQ